MRKIISLIICLLFAINTHAVQNTQKEVVENRNINYSDSILCILNNNILEKLDSICLNTHQEPHIKNTAEHTKPLLGKNWNYFLPLFVSVLAAAFAFGSFRFSKKTAENVDKRQIKNDAQREIFKDLIRHFYRNKIRICLIRWHLEDKGFDKYYPSEDHLLKLKVLPEDIRIDRFENLLEHYQGLHKFSFFLRNYNIEAEVAMEHLKSKSLSKQEKEADLDLLERESQTLTREIQKLTRELDMTEISNEEITEMLKAVSEVYEERQKTENVKVAKIAEVGSVPERKPDYNYYDNELKLTSELNKDILFAYYDMRFIKFS